MAVLVYTESENNTFKKAAFEVASYAREIANQLNTSVTAVSFNTQDTSALSNYGIDKAITVNTTGFDAKNYAVTLADIAKQEDATVVIISSSTDSKFIAPLLSVKLEASYASNVVALPESLAPFTVKRTAFSNKAFALNTMDTPIKVIGLSSNAFGIKEHSVSTTQETFQASTEKSNLTSVSLEKASGVISIADADVVVSGGRGLKGPENWHLIEDLAKVLEGATACSKPVSDLGWRPHNEHVGQTGKPVASNLYIAIGISGAIQHIAGINASKVKVVINTDPEAPFFKVADYGIVGDAFEVVPALIEKLKKFKANNA